MARTALQQLIDCIPIAEEIKEYISEYQPDTKMLDEWLWEKIYKNKNWIELEKQQIIDAFLGHDSDTEDNLEVAETYYNETYNE